VPPIIFCKIALLHYAIKKEFATKIGGINGKKRAKHSDILRMFYYRFACFSVYRAEENQK
jgi:hypothetical protein